MAPCNSMLKMDLDAHPSPLHALVSCCEIQLQNLHNGVRIWQKSWRSGGHSVSDPDSDASLEAAEDDPGPGVSGRSAASGSSVKEGESTDEIWHQCTIRKGGQSGRWVDPRRWQRSCPSTSLEALQHEAWKGQAKGVLRGIGVDHRKSILESAGNQDGDALHLTAARLSLLPFASIKFPKFLDPHLLGDPLASCRHAAPPAAQLIDRVKQAARTVLLKSSGSVVLPEPNVKLSHWEPYQGDTVAVLITVPRPRGLIDHFHLAIRQQFPALGPLVSVAVEQEDVPAFPRGGDGGWRALIPTTPLDKSGTRELQVGLFGKARFLTCADGLQCLQA